MLAVSDLIDSRSRLSSRSGREGSRGRMFSKEPGTEYFPAVPEELLSRPPALREKTEAWAGPGLGDSILAKAAPAHAMGGRAEVSEAGFARCF